MEYMHYASSFPSRQRSQMSLLGRLESPPVTQIEAIALRMKRGQCPKCTDIRSSPWLFSTKHLLSGDIEVFLFGNTRKCISQACLPSTKDHAGFMGERPVGGKSYVISLGRMAKISAYMGFGHLNSVCYHRNVFKMFAGRSSH